MELTEEQVATLDELVSGPYTIVDDGRIDCTLHHPTYGDIPFTSDENDVEELGRLVHAYASIKIQEGH